MAANNATIQKQLDAMNKHNASTFASFYRQDAVVFDPMYPDLLKGKEAIEKDAREFFAAFPDLEVSIERAVETGDTIAYELSLSGTHTGPLLGPAGHIPATNKKVKVGGAAFTRVDDKGQIVEERRYYDLAGMLGQLGLMQ